VAQDLPDGSTNWGSAILVKVEDRGPDGLVGTYLTAGHVVELEDSPVEVQLFVPGSLEPRYVMEVVKVVRKRPTAGSIPAGI
jgi:hypothetical protein